MVLAHVPHLLEFLAGNGPGGIDDAAYSWPISQNFDPPMMAGSQRDFLRDPASMSNGERQFRRKCSICNSPSDDKARRAGPNLHDLFGRAAGTIAGYNCSEVMANSGIIWSGETIDRLFDLGPEHYVPGTKMPMQRITSPQDREDLIEFLRDHTRG